MSAALDDLARRLPGFQRGQQAGGQFAAGSGESPLHGGQHLRPGQAVALHAHLALALRTGPVGLLCGGAGVLRIAATCADQPDLAFGDRGAVEVAVLIQQLLEHLGRSASLGHQLQALRPIGRVGLELAGDRAHLRLRPRYAHAPDRQIVRGHRHPAVAGLVAGGDGKRCPCRRSDGSEQ